MLKDEVILKKLAQEYREAAFSEKNIRNKELQIAVNDLHMIRPVVLIDELPWHELNAEGELTLFCEDPYLREIELQMRQALYRWRHIPADMVVPQAVRVGKVIHTTGCGFHIREDSVSIDAQQTINSKRFYDQLEDESSLELFHNETITYDKEESERRFDLVSNMIGDIIPVRLIGNQWIFDTLWDDIAQLHGVENTMIDLLERPEYMHALAEKLTDIYIDKIRQYDKLDLFEGAQDSLHCTAAYTEDLPSDTFDGVRYHTKDVWGRGAAQVFTTVSPAMREEFDLPYMIRAMEPFGLVYYGCCEPLHNQIDIISKIPHLRKITVTPWADYDLAAEQIGKRFVASTKARPSVLALPDFNEDEVRKELQTILNACVKSGCSFELVLKDVSTVAYHPENLFRWEKIAMEMIRNL